MILRKGLIAVGILLGLMGLASCGSKAKDETVYQYKETSVYYDGFKISKTVYTAGEMKLYYSGAEFDSNNIAATERISQSFPMSLSTASRTES